MALIICEECKKEISGTAISCPHCGFVRPGAQKVTPQVRASKINEAKKNPALGIVLILVSIVVILFSFLIMPFGILSLIAGLFLLAYGVSLCTGTQKVNCPYCGKAGALGKNAANMKCPYCKKTSVRVGDELRTVE